MEIIFQNLDFPFPLDIFSFLPLLLTIIIFYYCICEDYFFSGHFFETSISLISAWILLKIFRAFVSF